jgi:hypothetical protein
MSHHPHYGKVFSSIKNEAPLNGKKHPVIAFAVGFLFGPFGIALYFQSWKELLNCLVMLVIACFALPGVGAIVGWLAAGVYGAYRAYTSNEKLGY